MIRAVLCITLTAGCYASHPHSDGRLEDAGAPWGGVFDAGARDAGPEREPDAGQRPDTGVDAAEPVQPCIEGADGVIEGDVSATTLAEVMALTGIREVHGALQLYQLAPEVVAALPAALGCLERIEGELELVYLPGPFSLTSLARLGHVEGIRITGCDGLRDLTGLEFLTEVSGDLWLDENYGLASLEALRKVTHVAGTVTVGANAITSLHDLDNLAAVEGTLYIRSGQSMLDLDGLSSLVRIGGNLIVAGNGGLTRFTGLENLQSVGGDVAITTNSKLQDLSGLGALSTVGGGFGIYHNPLLSRCDGERVAKQLGRPCGWPGQECEGLCTCVGNLNDVTCEADVVE